MGHQEIAGVLRELVVLCCALGVDCNGHPASVVVKNQTFANTKNLPKSPDRYLITIGARERRLVRRTLLEGVRDGVSLAIGVLYNISKFARRNRAASDTR